MQNKSNISIILTALLLNTSIGCCSSLSQQWDDYIKKYPSNRLLTLEELDEKLNCTAEKNITLIPEIKQKQLNKVLGKTEPKYSVNAKKIRNNRINLLSDPNPDQLTQLIQACLQPAMILFNENEKNQITTKLENVSVAELAQGCSDFYTVNKIDVQSPGFIKSLLQAFIHIISVENLEKVVSDSHLFPLLDQKFKDWIQLLNQQIKTGSISDEGSLKNFIIKWSSVLLSSQRILKVNNLSQNIPLKQSVLLNNVNINIASSNIIQNNSLQQAKNTIEKKTNDAPQQSIDLMIETQAVNSAISKNSTERIETNVPFIASTVISTLNASTNIKDEKTNINMKNNDINKIAVFSPGERVFHANFRDRTYEREKINNHIIGGTASLNGNIQRTERSNAGIQSSERVEYNANKLEYNESKGEAKGLIRERDSDQIHTSQEVQRNLRKDRQANIERNFQGKVNENIINEGRSINQNRVAKNDVKKRTGDKVLKSNNVSVNRIVRANRRKANNKRILNTLDNINNLDVEILKKKNSLIQDSVDEEILKDENLEFQYQMDQSISDTNAVKQFQEN